ncbi:hypothetical protein KCU93_g10435, partial [Aureobasidium melanogenum]
MLGRTFRAGRTSIVGRNSRAGRSSGAGNSSEAPLYIDDGDDSEDGTPLKKNTTASGSKPPVILEIHRTSKPIVEVSPPVSKPSGSLKKKPERPRTSLQSAQHNEQDISTDTPAEKVFSRRCSTSKRLGSRQRRLVGTPVYEDEAGPSAVHQRLARPKGFQLSTPPTDDVEEGPSNE